MKLTPENWRYWAMMAFVALVGVGLVARGLTWGGIIGLVVAAWAALALALGLANTILWFTGRKQFDVVVTVTGRAVCKLLRKASGPSTRKDDDA